MKIGRRYTFAAAHALPHVPEGHKCGRMHGHTYTLEVEIQGSLDTVCDWIADFADVDAIVNERVIRQLDHRTLNDVPGLANPTSEAIVIWVRKQLGGLGFGQVVRVRVAENDRSWAEWSAG